MEKDLHQYQVRKTNAEKSVVLAIILTILTIVIAVLVSGGELSDSGLVITILILLIPIVIGIIGVRRYQKVSHDFKGEFLKQFLKSSIDEGEFRPKTAKGGKIQGLNPLDVYGTEFLERADRFHSYDYLGGKIDGVKFVSSDVKLERLEIRYVTRNGRSHQQRHYVTFFQGRVFHFDFNKHFDGHVQVLERYSPKSNRKYYSVKLESIDFNKKFKTYATNKHTAFYILTPHFMEALMRIEKNHPGRLGFSFIDNKLYFAMHTGKSTFAIRPFVKINESLLNTFKEDLDILYQLVDELKLNNRIFVE